MKFNQFHKMTVYKKSFMNQKTASIKIKI